VEAVIEVDPTARMQPAGLEVEANTEVERTGHLRVGSGELRTIKKVMLSSEAAVLHLGTAIVKGGLAVVLHLDAAIVKGGLAVGVVIQTTVMIGEGLQEVGLAEAMVEGPLEALVVETVIGTVVEMVVEAVVETMGGKVDENAGLSR
jgi:hypothetical protein